MRHRIKSFSLLEMVIVMLLSSMVIAIGYQGYVMFYRQFLGFRGRADANARISMFDSRIFSDCADSREVRKTGNGIAFIFKNKTITYLIEGDNIVRRQEAVQDTFQLATPEVSMKFGGLPAEVSGLVDEINIETRSGEEVTTFRYRKRYGADVIINQANME